jgi:hypothetical protein
MIKDRVLQDKLSDLGLNVIERHIFLCADQTEANCAPKKKTLTSWDFLKRRLTELNLDKKGGIYRSKVNCPSSLYARTYCGSLSGSYLV